MYDDATWIMATSMSAQVEEAVCAYVLALRARGGHLAHAGGLAQRMARRILRLNARDGYTAEKPLEPLLEAAGFDPVTLRIVDYEKAAIWLESGARVKRSKRAK